MIGGDIYTYFFPLKAWYAERLRHGEVALWNPRIGHGAPVLGESQTGVFYPFNLVLYGLLPVNAAFNASFLVHYVLAFGFTGLYARRLGLGLGATLLAAVVFVYGWFPPRNCLEWAIVTGTWMPLVLWGVESFITQRRAWYWAVTALAVAVQLLAGHFNLAFITLVTVTIYAPLRCLTLGQPLRQSGRLLFAIALSVCLGVGMAAVQLVPSLELKNRSQRQDPRFREHGLRYGALPVWYLPQVVVPWDFFPHVNEPELRDKFGRAYTNKIEAHLYFGLVPLLIAALSLTTLHRNRILWIWLLLSGAGVVMATGCWTELLGGLPGFGYFTGPGRYGIVTQLGVAVAAAFGFREFVGRFASTSGRTLLATIALVGTWFDLEWAADAVQYASIVPTPPIHLLEQSPVAKNVQPTDRVLSRNANSITLCGSAMLPIYLGIGPAEYERPPTKLPDEFRWDGPLTEPVVDWLRHAGVTHVLAFEPHADWPCELVWRGVDPMLHYMLARHADELFWLYRLNGSLGRAYWLPAGPRAGGEADTAAELFAENPIAHVVETANRAELEVDLPTAATVVLTELAFPGWRVEVDGHDAPAETHREMYRSVKVGPGPHTIVWKYRPASLWWGVLVSSVSLVTVIVVGVRRHRVECVDG